MLKLFHAATWLFAMTLSVRPAYASVTLAPPCDVLYQVCIAPTARARIVPSSIRKVIGSVCPLTTGTNSAVLTLLRSRAVARIGDLELRPRGRRGSRGLVFAPQGKQDCRERSSYRQLSHETVLSPMRVSRVGARR